MDSDHIDRVVQLWKAERPDYDLVPIEIIGRAGQTSLKECYYHRCWSTTSMKLILVGTIVLIPFFLPGVVKPSQGQAVEDRLEDRAAIKAIVQGESDAWNRGDAEAFAAHYAEDGSFTNVIGQQLYGRKAFVEQHARIFSTIYKGSHNTFTIGRVKFLRADIAVVDIDGVLRDANRLPPGLKALEDGALHVKLQEVMTKESGGWMIAAFHNVAVYPLPPQN